LSLPHAFLSTSVPLVANKGQSPWLFPEAEIKRSVINNFRFNYYSQYEFLAALAKHFKNILPPYMSQF
jgi:hypothetical protein